MYSIFCVSTATGINPLTALILKIVLTTSVSYFLTRNRVLLIDQIFFSDNYQMFVSMCEASQWTHQVTVICINTMETLIQDIVYSTNI